MNMNASVRTATEASASGVFTSGASGGATSALRTGYRCIATSSIPIRTHAAITTTTWTMTTSSSDTSSRPVMPLMEEKSIVPITMSRIATTR